MADRDEQIIAFEAHLIHALIHRGFANVAPYNRQDRYGMRAVRQDGRRRRVELCRSEMSEAFANGTQDALIGRALEMLR
jgi:hypothetical protein